jgi:hypothetical protein
LMSALSIKAVHGLQISFILVNFDSGNFCLALILASATYAEPAIGFISLFKYVPFL